MEWPWTRCASWGPLLVGDTIDAVAIESDFEASGPSPRAHRLDETSEDDPRLQYFLHPASVWAG